VRLPELHPYDVPELLLLDVSDGFPPYVGWLREHTVVHDRKA
jgi:periplasmic divalent cation tolerance protein